MYLRVGEEIIDLKRVENLVCYHCGILDLDYENGEEERIRIEDELTFEITSKRPKSKNKV